MVSVLKMSGEHCEISGLYKAHCAHAIERSFTNGQQFPRCERCPFDVLWVLVKPELLVGQESPPVSKRVTS